MLWRSHDVRNCRPTTSAAPTAIARKTYGGQWIRSFDERHDNRVDQPEQHDDGKGNDQLNEVRDPGYWMPPPLRSAADRVNRLPVAYNKGRA